MKNKKGMNRRNFIKTSAISIAGAGMLYSSKDEINGETSTPVKLKIKEYRTLGRTGFKVSDIGVGKPFNEAILKVLLDSGVNYIDTAESYGRGRSEKVIGEVIKGRDRKSLFINSKLSMRGNPDKGQILSRARKCLERLKTDYLDCMIIHSCGDIKTLNYQPFHDAMNQLKSEGKLRFVGLSNHGNNYNDVPETMEKVLLTAVHDGRFDLMLLVYNFLKRDMGEKILKACKEKNIGTTLIKVNPVGSYYAYKARLEESEKEGKPNERYRKLVPRLKKRVDQCQDFIKKNNLKSFEEIRAEAYRFVLKNHNAHSALFHFTNFDEISGVIGVSGTGLKK